MGSMSGLQGKRIHITGVVQGVGFRPFVYALAQRLALTGWVRNTSAGVDIEVDGPVGALDAFMRALQTEAPPLAHINSIEVDARSPNGFTHFDIIHSQAVDGAFQPISPDISICPDCLRELFDPADRRYRYPFINCTNCGPRFTIIEDIPYDRPKTTMASFPLCSACAEEYHNPLDRRFHAQPVACPVCGPQVWLEMSGQSSEESRASGQTAIETARRLLAEGKIVAIKGIGGFHLACDATNATAVAELRRRKLRVDKPFAVMLPDMAIAARHCFIGEAETALLTSQERPIVILPKRPDSTIVDSCAPNQTRQGIMLPYTPLHYLLIEQAPVAGRPFPPALVMTSGNLSQEPIATSNGEARRRLAGLADAFLMHNRDIHTRCDDSVVSLFDGQPVVRGEALNPHPGPASAASPELPLLLPLRRARGYAPFPVQLPRSGPSILAVGAELKNSFCLTRQQFAFLSHHIGDLENYETLRSFEEGVAHYERLFRIRPQLLAYDLHPDYLATRYAWERTEREGIPAVGVQHHHAHIAACMVEHGLAGDRPVIGVAFDGTGYGTDGAVWGGEFLAADYAGYERLCHLAYVPLPGGDKAVREPWRLALAYLHQSGLPWHEDLPPLRWAASRKGGVEGRRPIALSALRHQLENGINAPLTSSMGRLFDAIAALVGVRQVVNYEAQAAIELEALADPAETGSYPFEVDDGQVVVVPLIEAVAADVRAGVEPDRIAARFHNSVARMVQEVCRRLRAQTGLDEVALSGGVWQNVTLLSRTVTWLCQDGFTVYLHREVPANDGGLALGQAAVAALGQRAASG